VAKYRVGLYGALLVAVAACGESTAPTPRGTFQATVSGDLSLNLSGEAIHGTVEIQGDTVFVLAMVRGTPGADNSDLVTVGRDNPATPAPGAYPIFSGDCIDCTADDFTAAYLHQVTLADFGFFVSDTGAFTVATAIGDTLQGSFAFAATLTFPLGDDSVALEGTFTAVPGDVASIIQ
jgi:hypothetical protein